MLFAAPELVPVQAAAATVAARAVAEVRSERRSMVLPPAGRDGSAAVRVPAGRRFFARRGWGSRAAGWERRLLWGQVVVACASASARALSRERRAGPRQPQEQWAKQKEPRSVVPVRWVGASGVAS
ncbi:hypothetical protein GCM10010353_55250 [Streptomyces chryseus]|nr:hypothetical protein GCM10010353_55250 [Streptomyces chryseus]